MRIIVSFSGGKDSTASLIWAVNRYGSNNIEAVFCDTGHEAKETYEYINHVIEYLGVKLTVLKGKYTFESLARKKGRFPAYNARFCTTELKIRPMINWLLDEVKDHCIIIQGIRWEESYSRSKMPKECRFFNLDDKNLNIRRKDIRKWIAKYDDSVLRPIIEWDSLAVMAYILNNGLKPNPLYYKGFKRVGCFPCIMSTKSEIKAFAQSAPERLQWLVNLEAELMSGFFSSNLTPEKFWTGDRNGTPFPTIPDYFNARDNGMEDMFADDEEVNGSCMSFYHLCE